MLPYRNYVYIYEYQQVIQNKVLIARHHTTVETIALTSLIFLYTRMPD
jgi:hypothetical protein